MLKSAVLKPVRIGTKSTIVKNKHGRFAQDRSEAMLTQRSPAGNPRFVTKVPPAWPSEPAAAVRIKYGMRHGNYRTEQAEHAGGKGGK